ncbi:hypothetical protein GmHk_15G044833 [Glycine max]|nr:hypothetical protein GmHk_15G044833 [Glycine max]
MEKELIVGAIVAASLQVAIDRLASRPVLNFFRRRKLDDLRKLKEKLRTMVDNNRKAWLDEVKDALFDAEDPLNVIDYEFFECELEAEFESQTKALQFQDQPSSSWELVEKREKHKSQECVNDNSCQIVVRLILI